MKHITSHPNCRFIVDRHREHRAPAVVKWHLLELIVPEKPLNSSSKLDSLLKLAHSHSKRLSLPFCALTYYGDSAYVVDDCVELTEANR